MTIELFVVIWRWISIYTHIHTSENDYSRIYTTELYILLPLRIYGIHTGKQIIAVENVEVDK